MRRLLHILLILSLLATGLAWATDRHAPPLGGETPITLQNATQPDHSTDLGTGCHFASCGIAHVAGFTSEPRFSAERSRPPLRARYAYSIISHQGSLPSKPPRV